MERLVLEYRKEFVNSALFLHVLLQETIRKEERIVDAVEEESTVERSKRILLEQVCHFTFRMKRSGHHSLSPILAFSSCFLLLHLRC